MPRLNYLFLILLLPLLAIAQQSASSAGNSSNLLLRFGASARVSSLSEAFTGLADDENALLYNPGGLPNLKTSILTLNHSEWLEEIRIDNLIYGQKLSYNSAIALGITHLWMPSIQGKNQYGQKTEMFDVSSSIIQLGIGYKIHRASYLGITVKYFQDRLADRSASGLAFDAGFFMQTMIRKLTFGLVVQNLGTEIKYAEAKQIIPLTYRIGLAYRFFADQIGLAADLVKSSDTDIYLNTGLEFKYQNYFFLRIGNQYLSYQSFNLAYGAGFNINNHFQANYTFAHRSELGSTHRLGFSIIFGSSSPNYTPTKTPKRENLQGTDLPKGEVRVSLIEEQLLISWEALTGSTYDVYARAENQKDWFKLNTEDLKVNFFKFKKPAHAGKYIFKVSYSSNNLADPFTKEVTFDVEE